MEKLEKSQNKKEIIREFFKWLFDKEDINLIEEVDLSLAPLYYDPNIYYTKEISDFFNTQAMKRLGKVSQLGVLVSQNPNCYHNRLEHSKGTYNRKLEELIYLTSNEKYKKFVEHNNLKQYLTAELIKEAAHDIGHLPLSHVMEIKVVGRREFHEDIGKRILLEDPEIGKVLENISPNLKEALKKLIEENVLNLKSHDEGNYDVDRLDYILRDHLYSGIRVKDYTHEQYTRKYAKLDENGNIMKNEDGSIIILNEKEENDETISKKRIDVYENDSLKAIENFLETRVQAYKNIYFSESVQVKDSMVGLFVNSVLEQQDDTAKELKDFIKKLKEQDMQIDLQEYLKWDDIRFYTNCLDIAENSNNQDLRDFSGMIIPNLFSLMNLTFAHLDLKNARQKNYSEVSEYDKDFIRKIKEIIYSNSSVSRMIKDKEFYDDNCLICADDEEIEEVREKLGDKVSYSEATVFGYKTNMPIYIKDQTGRTFTLHEHPERSCDWPERKESISVVFSAIPLLKLNGFTDEQIEEVKEYLKRPTIKKREISNNQKINMTPLKVHSSMEEYFEL